MLRLGREHLQGLRTTDMNNPEAFRANFFIFQFFDKNNTINITLIIFSK